MIRSAGSLVPSWEREERYNLAMSTKILKTHTLTLQFHYLVTNYYSKITTSAQKFLNVCIHTHLYIHTYIHPSTHSHTYILLLYSSITSRNSNKRWTQPQPHTMGFACQMKWSKLSLTVKGSIVWNNEMLSKIYVSMRHLRNTHISIQYRAIKPLKTS